jgi:hypothetical protein
MKPTYLIAFFLVVLLSAFKGKKLNDNRDRVSGKIFFSNKPFGADNSGSKESFSSNEFIYCRLELSGNSIKDVFKIGETTKEHPYSFLNCEMEVLKDGEPVGYHKLKNNHVLLSQDNLSKTSLNLDILPEPARATTLYSMLDDFTAGYGYFPLYSMINPDYFPSAGKYRINVRLFSKTNDLWGKEEEEDKWPFVEDGFDFTLRETDIAALNKNHQASWDLMKGNAFRYDKLPDVFSKPMKIADPKATPAKIAAILKRDLSNRIILKWVVEQYNGPLWSIAKDDFNLPKYRYFNPHIHVAYKLEGQCRIGTVTLRENYEGGGKYGPLEVAFTSASEKQDRGIDCSKIK